MKVKYLNWSNVENGRDKKRLMFRTIAMMLEIVFKHKPLISGKINFLFDNHLGQVEIARLEPYGGAFIYFHALGGFKEVDHVNGHYFWRWLEEWQWPEIIMKYKITPQGIRKNIKDISKKYILEIISNIQYDPPK